MRPCCRIPSCATPSVSACGRASDRLAVRVLRRRAPGGRVGVLARPRPGSGAAGAGFPRPPARPPGGGGGGRAVGGSPGGGRGLASPADARAFLAAGEEHALSAFPGLAEAAAGVLEHVSRGSRITVHGDYDVDGICATAVLVRALRSVGADVDWYLPSRIDDGYGLALGTVERLAARGTDLLVTVDCAVTAVDEVAAARVLGLDVIV